MPLSAGAWRVALGLTVLVAVVGGLLWALFSLSQTGTGEEAARDYREAISGAGLQVDVEALPEDVDWRDPSREPNGFWDAVGQFFSGILSGLGWVLLAIARLLFSPLGWVLMVVLIVGFLVMMISRFGGFGALRWGAEPSADGYSQATSSPPVVDEVAPSLDEIAAMSDLPHALGALLRLVLEAAARLAGIALSRSDTAREALRRLPHESGLYGVVEALVRVAERVRYGGATITRDQFEALIDSVRDLLAEAETAKADAGS